MPSRKANTRALEADSNESNLYHTISYVSAMKPVVATMSIAGGKPSAPPAPARRAPEAGRSALTADGCSVRRNRCNISAPDPAMKLIALASATDPD